MEIGQWLLFNRIQSQGRALAVIQGLEGMAVIIAGLAAAAMARRDGAVMRAKAAGCPAVFGDIVISGFYDVTYL